MIGNHLGFYSTSRGVGEVVIEQENEEIKYQSKDDAKVGGVYVGWVKEEKQVRVTIRISVCYCWKAPSCCSRI